MTQPSLPLPIPARPILLGRIGYGAMVEGDTPREVLREEEPFWARLSGLLYDGYRADIVQGRYFSAFGRDGVDRIAAPVLPVEAEPATDTPAAAEPSTRQTLNKTLELPRGVPVMVKRSNGEMEPDWVLKARSPSGQALVSKESEHGTLSKLVGLEALLFQNLSLIPIDTLVKVPRSSGTLDEGWITRGFQQGRLLVERPGVGRKQLTAEQFIPFNRELWGGERETPEMASKPRALDVSAGSIVRMRKANGEWGPEWTVASQADGGLLNLERESEHGLLKMRKALDEALEENPQLFPVGMPVRVPRSNGSLEDGWFIQEATFEHVVVEKPGVGSKELKPEDLIPHNRDRLLGEGASPAVAPSEEAAGQRWTFARENRLDGWIWDGFADGGRDVSLDSLGWPVSARREILVIDRLSDSALRRHLSFARELTPLPQFQRAAELVRFVFDQMGGPVTRIEARVALACANLRGEAVLIGDVPRLCGGGLARHRALLFQILAEEAGLRPVLVRGFAGVTCPSAHAWNELVLGESQLVLVDLCRPPDLAFAALADARTRRFYHDGSPQEVTP